jgi:hypothetical protein
MAACPECRIRHAPYTCEQYQRLRAAENAADEVRWSRRSEDIACREEQLERRRRHRLFRRRPSSA